jgi:hypothetical protein
MNDEMTLPLRGFDDKMTKITSISPRLVIASSGRAAAHHFVIESAYDFAVAQL